MTQLDYERIETVTSATADTIDRMIDELEIPEVERRIYKNLILSMIRSERLDAAIVIQEHYTERNK